MSHYQVIWCCHLLVDLSSIFRINPDKASALKPRNWGKKFLLCFAARVLTFFIAGLLYLLCFEHADNLGAYSIPSETGLRRRKPLGKVVG